MEHTANYRSGFSLKQQSAYGTALAETDITQAHPFEGDSQFEHELDKFSNRDEANRGHLWATERKNMTVSTNLSRSFRASSFMLAWAFCFGMGDVTESQPDDVGAPNTYQYDIKPLNIVDSGVGQQLPVTTYSEKISSFHQFLFRDMLIKSIKYSGKLKEFLKLSVDMIGSGYKETSTMTMPGLVATSFLRFPDVAFTWGGQSYSPELKSFEYSYENENDEDGGYTPQSGYMWENEPNKKAQIRSQLLTVDQKTGLKFQVAMKSADLLNDYETNEDRAVVLTAEGDLIEDIYKHKIIVTMPKAVITTNKVGKDNKLYVYDCDVEPNWDETSQAPVTVQIITNVGGILALPA